MIRFKIDGKPYEIPDFINIENYSKIYKIKDFFSDEYFAAKLINIVSGASVEDLLNSDYNEVNYLASYVLSILPKNETKFDDKFEIDGVEYGFFRDWRNLTFAEFIDMDTISTKKPDELLDMLDILSAIMYRPIINKRSEHDFDIEDYDVKTMKERAELFKKKLNIKYVIGAQFFFIKFANKFSNYSRPSLIQTLSMWEWMKLIWKMRKIIWKIARSKKSTGGMLSSTELLKTILQDTSMYTRKK